LLNYSGLYDPRSRSARPEGSSSNMFSDKGQEPTGSASVQRITWFAPDRPVENGTVFVRPEVLATPVEDDRTGGQLQD
jgi:hypothetical protein